jgi:hypothetical protein
MIHAASFVLLALIAQAAPPTASPEGKARAQALLKEGARLYEKGALLPALEKFNEAYAEFPSPKLLFNIGQTSRDLGRFVDAMVAFERFLDEAPEAPADMIAEAKKSMAELQGRLGKLRIQCSKVGAEISVDGKPVGTAPITQPVWAAQGSHQVTARHPATAAAVEDVEVNPGWVHTVVMTLQPLVEAAPVVVAPPPPKTPKPAVDVETRRSTRSSSARTAKTGESPGRVWTWVAAGSAVAFGGAAIGFGLATRAKFDDLNQSCGSGSVSTGQSYAGCSDSQVDGVLLRRNLTNVSLGLAAAAAATAGLLFFVEGRGVSVAPMAGDATGVLARVAY